MRAVTFNVSIPRFVTARSLGRVTESALFGALSGVRRKEVSLPELPGPEWVELEVVAAGICGSDVANVTFASSPAMEPFASFPAVLGHEILARVARVGSKVSRVEPGQRVVVDPVISCRVRGFPPGVWCFSCASGQAGTCEMAGEEGAVRVDGRRLSRGLTIGYHRDLPGGWGERLLAHESQLHAVPDEIEDRAAVLIEPLSIGMRAALGSRPLPEGPVLVIGSGPIALGAIWALRAIGCREMIVAQTKRAHEARMARRLGATEVVKPGMEARQAMVDTGAMAYQPLVGAEVFSGGGFPLIFDCVGSRETVSQALRFASPRGKIVLLGCAGEISKLDLTFVWARELRVRGYVCYGEEEWTGEREHTFEVTRELMLRTRAPLAELVTHVFPLEQYREGLSVAANHRKSDAIKVLLRP